MLRKPAPIPARHGRVVPAPGIQHSARNQGDQIKNISFLNRAGERGLALAYDVTYSLEPANPWMRQHQLFIRTKRDDFRADDLLTLAKEMDVRKAKDLLRDVLEAVGNWPARAEAALVPKKQVEAIARTHRLYLGTSL